MKNKKGISALIIVIAIALLLGIALVIIFVNSSSKKEETPIDEYAGWKTYTSEYAGLQFRYPKDWTTIEISSTDKSIAGVSDEADKVLLYNSSQKPLVYWSSYSTGPSIPACDVNSDPGVTSKIINPDDQESYLRGCSQITILSMTKLPNLKDLYYVEAYITNDSVNFIPICTVSAEQSLSEIIRSYTFSPRFGFDGSKGENEYQLLCQSSNVDSLNPGLPEFKGSKESVISNFKQEPFLTIKKIIMSAKSK